MRQLTDNTSSGHVKLCFFPQKTIFLQTLRTQTFMTLHTTFYGKVKCITSSYTPPLPPPHSPVLKRRSLSSSEPNSRRMDRKSIPKAFCIPNTDPLHHMEASITTHPQPPSGCTNSTSSAPGAAACSGTLTLPFPFFIFSSSSGRFSSAGTSAATCSVPAVSPSDILFPSVIVVKSDIR